LGLIVWYFQFEKFWSVITVFGECFLRLIEMIRYYFASFVYSVFFHWGYFVPTCEHLCARFWGAHVRGIGCTKY